MRHHNREGDSLKDAAELKNHVYDIVGALHSVHDELGPGINEYC